MNHKKVRISGGSVKSLLKWDKISSASIALFKKDTWKRICSTAVWREFLSRDLISIVHLSCVIVIVAVCLLCYHAYGNGGMIISLGLFAYLNVFVTIIALRRRNEETNLMWSLLRLWGMGIGVGVIIASAWNGWEGFFSVCGSFGFIVVPVMLLNSDFRQKISPAFSQMFHVGGSADDLLPGCLGGVLGLMLMIVLMGLAGSIVMFIFYVGTLVELSKIFEEKDVSDNYTGQLQDGVILID